jgi:hypothetical protein
MVELKQRENMRVVLAAKHYVLREEMIDHKILISCCVPPRALGRRSNRQIDGAGALKALRQRFAVVKVVQKREARKKSPGIRGILG